MEKTSDSQAVPKSVDSSYCRSEIVWNNGKCPPRLEATNGVTLIWIPRHTGQKGNGKAVVLERKRAETLFIGPEPDLGTARSSAKERLTFWQEENGRIHFHILQGLRHSTMLLESAEIGRTTGDN